MQSHSITLGMNIPNAGSVTNQMWIQFLNDQVLPLLQYATITDSMGIYQGTLERSKTISVTTDDSAIVDALLQVGNLYKKAFNQDAIMYNATPVPLLTFRWQTLFHYVNLPAESPYSLQKSLRSNHPLQENGSAEIL